jgi:serine/threonine-protein kinase RsbT
MPVSGMMVMLPDNSDKAHVPLLQQSWDLKGGNFLSGGNVSTKIKALLKEIEISPDIIRRAAICCYEAEMNVVMYARSATITLEIYPSELVIVVEDQGPGIPDLSLAMQEGWSTATQAMQERGFGAGMGLPNIKRNSDIIQINSTVGRGTVLRVSIALA